MSKLIAKNQTTLMTLNERAELRKETFYKLTNSADVPEAPSGSRNLFKGSRDFSGSSWINNHTGVYAEDYQGVKIFKKQTLWGGVSQYFEVKTGEEYVFSAYVKSSAKTDRVLFYLNHGSKQPKAQGSVSFGSVSNKDNIYFELTDEYQRIAIKIKITSDGWIMPRIERFNNDAYLFFGGYKFEKGETATPYSQAPEDLGWSTTTLVPTQQQRYLWKFEYIYYSDGSVEVTSPINISIAGADGTNGQTSHVHFAFADNATGGGFSLTTPKEYMGWYVDFTEADSNDPTKYRWAKWKGSDGAQGIPGTPGADGKTPYIHFAYADDDKGTNFSLTDNNQQYQGYYSDYTETNSNDYTKYKWVDRLANVQVGGRNLLINRPTNWQNKYVVISGASAGSFLQQNSTTRISPKEFISVEAGKQYTVSLKELADVDYYFKVTMSTVDAYGIANSMLNKDEWIRTKTYTFTAPEGCKYVMISVGCDAGVTPDDLNNKFNIKFEEGNVPTDYTEAPEDTQEQIDSKADQALTQEQLNALEAKRLLMETEMKALATLQQVSELETFINNLKQEDTDGRQKIIEITKAIEERVKDIEPIMEYSQKLQFMDTYITQGNGGMVIGANKSTTKVVVTPDRISFQSGGSEVAYISQRMLHIDNGVFTMSLQLGHFITRAHPKNEYVNATYFVK